ncbi:NAD-dependent dehydratase [Pedobacter sp. Leaf216]|uniref:NAD(P)H-binding protein n=1 Tax=Pedobacter sp. Leaf216 TaxID=1735684 RepID=UPI0006F52910|nr:NAD(P)H-binding protein [Pedobacter sp. Leaf216]KQM77021.1 NAD-dependent dehydratase [Pedobacter sp. Leaf216]
MKIIITGSLGNISRPLATTLISKGQKVTVISSNPEKSAEITQLGAEAAIGSVSDENFLIDTFKGADLVYLMVPPDFSVNDFRAYIKSIGQHYANAVKAAGVNKVVLLSSIGAHLAHGTGPIAGLHDVEQIFSGLENLDVLTLRPGFFYNNFYANIDLIKHMGIIGSNYEADQSIVLVDPKDIAAAAAEKIAEGFNGRSILYIASDKRKLKEVASAIGTAIGKADLPWVAFDDTQAYDGMVGAGLPSEIAKNYVEMGNAISSGILWEDFEAKNITPKGKIKLEDFAAQFALAYNS